MVAEDAAFRNAPENSDRENARVEAEKAIQRTVVAIMNDDTRLFGQLSGPLDFKRWLTDTAFRLTCAATDRGVRATCGDLAGGCFPPRWRRAAPATGRYWTSSTLSNTSRFRAG